MSLEFQYVCANTYVANNCLYDLICLIRECPVLWMVSKSCTALGGWNISKPYQRWDKTRCLPFSSTVFWDCFHPQTLHTTWCLPLLSPLLLEYPKVLHYTRPYFGAISLYIALKKRPFFLWQRSLQWIGSWNGQCGYSFITNGICLKIQGGAPHSYKWVIIPLTIDITP